LPFASEALELTRKQLDGEIPANPRQTVRWNGSPYSRLGSLDAALARAKVRSCPIMMGKIYQLIGKRISVGLGIVTLATVFERLAHDFKHVARKFGKFVEEENAIVS
jgi:hypothetical protein